MFRGSIFLKDKVDTLKEKNSVSEGEKKAPSGITFETKKVGKVSALKQIKDINVAQVNIRSTRGYRESIVSFFYKPEKQEKP